MVLYTHMLLYLLSLQRDILSCQLYLHFDSKLLQVLVVLNVGCNSFANNLCAFVAVLLAPFGKQLLITLGLFLLSNY
jgi:hypothetical protein